MSWTRTHEWWHALREVVAEIERRSDGTLPWEPRYAEIFGDRPGLRRALEYRWTLMQQAQVDGDEHSPRLQEVAARNRALLLVLESSDVPAAADTEYALVAAR